MSTVGFGNLSPSSAGSKIVCIGFACVGVALLGMLVNSFAIMVLENIRQETENRIAELRRRRYERRQRAAMNELMRPDITTENPLTMTTTDYNEVYGSDSEAKKEKESILGSEVIRKV